MKHLQHFLAASLRRIRSAWRYACARREFAELDERTLRDLGMGSSEFASYWAECHGQAERTRLRTAGCR